jgi:hypothetical protein
LLKRRKFDRLFVATGTPVFCRADEVIGWCLDGEMPDRTRELLERTRKFLRVEATGEDVAGVLRLEEDDEADDDDDA